MTDEQLMDAQTAARELMAEAAEAERLRREVEEWRKRALKAEANANVYREAVADHRRELKRLAALSEEEGTPLKCDPECSYCREWRAESPSPATPSEDDKCPRCGGDGIQMPGRFGNRCPRCGGSGRATPRGQG